MMVTDDNRENKIYRQICCHCCVIIIASRILMIIIFIMTTSMIKIILQIRMRSQSADRRSDGPAKMEFLVRSVHQWMVVMMVMVVKIDVMVMMMNTLVTLHCCYERKKLESKIHVKLI